MKLEAAFVRSAAGAGDLPRDGLAEIALVGRSNVGKSSLLNALVRRKMARTSGAPGKTRLANIYRVSRGVARPFYLVDLPGYGHARGDRAELEAVTQAYFGQARRAGPAGRAKHGITGAAALHGPATPALPAPTAPVAALLLVDVRHPGLSSDVQAWSWIRSAVDRAAIVGTKIDKLARGERIRAVRELESVFDAPVLPVSATSGEGLDELWILIDRLANSRSNSSPPHNPRPDAAEAPPPPKRAPPRRSSGSTSPRSRT